MCLLVLALTVASAHARFRMPEEVPVDRLIENVGKFVAEHPDSAQAHYTLARLHSLALVQKSRTLRIYPPRREGDLPWLDHQFHPREPKDELGEAELRAHLEAAVKSFRKALALAEKLPQPIYVLGYAYTLEAGSGVARSAPPGTEPPTLPQKETSRLESLLNLLASPDPEVWQEADSKLSAEGVHAASVLLKHLDDQDPSIRDGARRLLARLWKEAAIAAYLDAFDQAVENDLAIPDMPIAGIRSLVSFEAGEGWLRLVRERGAKEEEREKVKEVNVALEKLRGKPRRRITPIIFSVDRPRPLRALLAGGRTVRFDLDGDGVRELRPWLAPHAALLVWDPNNRGEITSGRQLFGSVTWWIFWDDGYAALAALDDDGDGWLAGAELTGLAAWRDANGNGTSEPGEVRSLADLGVRRLAVRATAKADGCPANPKGVEFADGRVLPSYDWIPSAVR
jgi:hypothetical protein